MTLVDLHLHLLPGVDDGARDEAESLRFARRLLDDGVREVTLTPHVGVPTGPWPTKIPAATERLRRALDRAELPLRVHQGGEVNPGGALRLGRELLDIVAQGPAGRRWLLLEVPFAGIDDGFLATCDALRGQGFALLIAHPERAAGFLQGGRERLAGEMQAGARLQVNVCSLLGAHGEAAREGAETLLRSGDAYVLASDAHPGSSGREHTLRDGIPAALAAGLPAEDALALVSSRPLALLRDGMTPSAQRAAA
jgi:protein-tyrosine phosphatase